MSEQQANLEAVRGGRRGGWRVGGGTLVVEGSLAARFVELDARRTSDEPTSAAGASAGRARARARSRSGA